MNKTINILSMAVLLVSSGVWVAQAELSYAHIPTTISEEAAAIIRMLPDPGLQPEAPEPNDINLLIRS